MLGAGHEAALAAVFRGDRLRRHCRQRRRRGATVLMPPEDVEGVGRMARSSTPSARRSRDHQRRLTTRTTGHSGRPVTGTDLTGASPPPAPTLRRALRPARQRRLTTRTTGHSGLPRYRHDLTGACLPPQHADPPARPSACPPAPPDHPAPRPPPTGPISSHDLSVPPRPGPRANPSHTLRPLSLALLARPRGRPARRSAAPCRRGPAGRLPST